MTLLAVLGNAWVVFSLLPPGRAATDLAYIGAMLAVVAAVLVQAGERQDRLVARLTAQAAVDALTGLATRRVLDDAAACALASTGAGTGLLVLDLDRFKVINDERGHPVGDDALAHVGDLLRRRADRDSIASRLGGDEMALLLPGWDREATIEVAEEAVRLVRDSPLRTADGPVPLTVSMRRGATPRVETTCASSTPRRTPRSTRPRPRAGTASRSPAPPPGPFPLSRAPQRRERRLSRRSPRRSRPCGARPAPTGAA